MTSHPAPLPALHHTAPVYGHDVSSKRRLGKLRKNVYSLDGYLSSTQPKIPPSNFVARPADLSQKDNLFQSEATEKTVMSPAETLLAGEGALVPLSSSCSHPANYSSESWRSQMLQCETQLRELVAQGVHEPPSLDRILQVMSLYDQATSEVLVHQGNTFLGTLLRLFRVEFCRAIFLGGSVPGESNGSPTTEQRSAHNGKTKTNSTSASITTTTAANIGYDGLPQTYFEETASLQRTKAALTSMLANGASGEALLLLEHQLEDKGEQVTWYESELKRVRGQYEQLAEECLGLRKTVEAQQREAAATQKRLQKDIQTLHVENKDLQIQLFRLRKQITCGMSTLLKDSYRQLKLTKLGLTQHLFNEGDERIALLVFLGQVETRVNEILDSYDNDFVLAPENSRRELQLKMAQSLTILLEEMHYCEASYRRLVGAHYVKVVEKGKRAITSGPPRSGDRRPSKRSFVGSPLQAIPVSVVHSGKDEEAPDETDGYVAMLFDPKIYEQFQARHAVQAQLQQFKKDRDKGGKIPSGDRENGERGRLSLLSTDGTFVSTAGPAEPVITSRQETLSTLFPGVIRGDQSKTERPGDPSGDVLPSSGGPSGMNMSAREEILKKWSLDSYAFANGASSGGARFLQQLALGESGTKSTAAPTKLGRSPPLPSGPSKRVRFGTVAVPTSPSSPATRPRTQRQQQQQQSGATSTVDTAPASSESLADVVERQKAEWIAQILGPPPATVAFTVPGRNPENGDVVVVLEKSAEVVPAELMMRRVLRHPMEDLCNERFLSTVEVFTGENPSQQRLLCRVNHIDPSLPIRVPEATNFVKVKYALTENAVPPGAIECRGNIIVNPTPVAPPRPATGTGTGAAAETAAASEENNRKPAVFRGNPSLRLFKVLSNLALVEGNLGLQYCAGAVNSTTASTVAFQRLNPMAPNRAPEWLLYQKLFGSYRSLAPRMMEVTTIDHIIMCASERYFARMEYRFNDCYMRAAEQCTNIPLRRDMAERLFKDMHTLSDFQEALVDELEARYGFPELVAKILYEMLCYLNAVADKDTVLAAYLNVVRGFGSPTEIHFMSYMLYHLSYCWPESSPSTPVPVEDVQTVLEYVYRNASTIMPIKPDTILNDYNMATRSAPLNFVSFRQFIASTMSHLEESILMHLQGLFYTYTQRALVDVPGWETYETVICKSWNEKDERRSFVRYLTSCLGVNRTSAPTLRQLTLLAASAWSSNLWE